MPSARAVARSYCLGCCWVLMGLLFYGGVMELTWIVGLAFYVVLEKLLPRRYRLDKLAGVFLLLWGGSVVFGWIDLLHQVRASTSAQQVMSIPLTAVVAICAGVGPVRGALTAPGPGRTAMRESRW